MFWQTMESMFEKDRRGIGNVSGSGDLLDLTVRLVFEPNHILAPDVLYGTYC